MDNCKHCQDITTVFSTIGKTYYRIENGDVLCFRHWHQLNRPKFVFKGEYHDVFSRYSTKYEKSKTS